MNIVMSFQVVQFVDNQRQDGQWKFFYKVENEIKFLNG